MPDNKITVSWDELKSRKVEGRLKEQEALARNRAYAELQASDLPQATAPSQSLLNRLWHNSAFSVALLGLVGGLLAWACSSAVTFTPSAQKEADEFMVGVHRLTESGYVGLKTPAEIRAGLDAIHRAAAANPYFQVYNDTSLTDARKQQRIAQLNARDQAKAFISNLLAFGVSGILIALCLAVAEPVVERNIPRAVINGSVGAALGLAGGVVVSLFFNRIYHAVGGAGDEAVRASYSLADIGSVEFLRQVVARAAAWGTLGLFLTLGPGLVLRNFKKMLIGMAGGLVGGLIGGAFYDPAILLTGSGEVGRLVAMLGIGVLAGLGTGLLENAAKTGWVRVITGLIAGKQFILYRNPTFVGSAPDCQIYLFKDPQVGRRHAAIHIVPGGFELEDLPLGAATLVNGKPVSRARLKHGDRVQIGSTCFIFQERDQEQNRAA